MRKCVKIIITDFGDLDAFYKLLKKKAPLDNLEGYAEPVFEEELHIVVYGHKEEVDDFVGSVEEIVLKENADAGHEIGFSVEPFIKDEDYRGIFRFIKKA